MKQFSFILILLTISFFSSAQTSPCNDPKYVELKAKGVANLSESEMVYYNQKDKECNDFLKSSKSGVNSELVNETNKAMENRNQQQKAVRKQVAKNKGRGIIYLILLGGLLYAAATVNK